MMRLLFIDDDEASLVLYTAICRNEGYEYIGIKNPLNISSHLPTLQDISAVFVDIEMPRMNGFQVLSLLKAQPSFHSVPIIACTVYNGNIEEARTAGFSGFINKPLNIDKFSGYIIAILKGQSIWETY